MYNLLINYFKSEQRDSEYIECIERNVNNKFIEKIHILFQGEIPEKFKDNEKIVWVKIDKRPTYHDFFSYANKNISGICILSNSDIYFDDSISKIDNYISDKKVLALSRWDVNHKRDRVFHLHCDSQDVWVFNTPINIGGMEIGFTLGIPGCDNRIAYEISRNYDVINPSEKIYCNHLHLIRFRNYTEKDRLRGKTKTVNKLK